MTVQEHRYHAGNDFYFARDTETGEVVISHIKSEVMRLDYHDWASVVATMSARGYNGDTYHEALNFHVSVQEGDRL